jgi:hypothetical protein
VKEWCILSEVAEVEHYLAAADFATVLETLPQVENAFLDSTSVNLIVNGL